MVVKRGRGKMGGKVLLVGNTSFSLLHYRLPLMRELIVRGMEVVAAANDEEGYGEKFRELGVRFVPLGIDHKGLNPFVDAMLLLRLAGLYWRERPRVVHHFTIKPVIYGSLAARMIGVPHIVNTVTGLGYALMKRGILRSLVVRMYRVSVSRRCGMIFQNRSDMEEFFRLGIGGVRRVVIEGSGVDTNELRPREGLEQRSGVRFAYIGRMLVSKGVLDFIDAARVVKQRYSQARFVMAGGSSGGGAKAARDAIACEWLESVNREGIVRWIGRVSFERVKDLLDWTDVVVLPSRYREGLSRCLIEAAAKGKAIIAANVPGCREVVVEGKNGYLVWPGDVDGLARRMISFVERPDLVRTMGCFSRKIAVERFDARKVVQETLCFYPE